MTATRHTLHTPATTAALRATAAALQALTERLRCAARAWRERQQARDALRSLAALDDRALRDLGLARSEILSIAHDPADESRRRIAWKRDGGAR